MYDPACKEFAIGIYRAIGTRYQPDSPEAAGNLGCFATQWHKAQRSGIGLHRMQVLWDKSMAEANKLKAKRRRGVHFRESPEAVWVWLFKRRLTAMVAEARDKSPPKSAVATG